MASSTIVCLLLLPWTVAARAQHDAPWSGSAAALSPAAAAAAFEEGAPPEPATSWEGAGARRVTRARSLVIVGASMAMSSLVSSLLIQTRGQCTFDGASADLTLPHVVSASLGGVGLGITAVGASLLARADERSRRSARTSGAVAFGRVFAAFGASLLTAAASSAAGYWAHSQTYGCIHG